GNTVTARLRAMSYNSFCVSCSKEKHPMSTAPSPPTNTVVTPAPPSRRRPRLLAAGALVAITAVMAACGGGGGAQNSSDSTSQRLRSAAATQSRGVPYAQCMRSQGVSDFRDPAIQVTPSAGTMVNLPKGISPDPDSPSPTQACRSLLPLPANGGASS